MMPAWLPPSKLIIFGAGKKQTNHAIIHLVSIAPFSDSWKVKQLRHGGLVHEWAHYMQNGAIEERAEINLWLELFSLRLKWVEFRAGWDGFAPQRSRKKL